MKVIARPGIRVPTEHHARTYITETDAIDVPDTAYYRRRIADGDLIETSTPVSVGGTDIPTPASEQPVEVQRPSKGGK